VFPDRVLVHEFVTGGGCYSLDDRPPTGSLLAEGRSMARAVIEDLLRIPGMRVARLLDARLDEPPIPGCRSYPIDSAAAEEREFKRLAAGAGVLVIAPETGGALAQRARWAIASGGRLLGPGPALVDLATDKHRLAERLIDRGVLAPRGLVIDVREPLPEAFPYPAVIKPLDGAGSIETRLVRCWSAAERGLSRPARLEVYHPGIAASVAMLCGPGIRVALPACGQRLSDDGRFLYRGAWTPLPAPLAARAEALARRVLGALDAKHSGAGDLDHDSANVEVADEIGDGSPLRGYLGVDLVLGPDQSGAEDVAIEVNPRLTTSYVALREAVEGNIMAAMLAAIEGRRVELRVSQRAVQFQVAPHARRKSSKG
jgi:predicted ATP-grasp superfamily ATP-dependent carboligase